MERPSERFAQAWHEKRSQVGRMQTVIIPKKFEIQFRHAGEGMYTGVLVVDGCEMGVGSPKSLDEITSFLMPRDAAPFAQGFASQSDPKS